LYGRRLVGRPLLKLGETPEENPQKGMENNSRA
jgi:hypothetical protein